MNKYKPHVLVLPEDRANSEIANGFLLNLDLNERRIEILPYVRGWTTVIDKFTNDHVSKMRQYPDRRIVLLIDFDRKEEDRLNYVKKQIPEDLKSRVFIIGARSEPEELKIDLRKSFEEIGETLSTDCSENKDTLWSHDLLRHNKTELDRMIFSVKPFLFG